MIRDGIDQLNVWIQPYDGGEIDISEKVTSLNIYENINVPFLEANLGLVDNSALVATLPIIGNERVFIHVVRGEYTISRSFRVASVLGISRLSEHTGSIALQLVSESAFDDAQRKFSRHFKGLNTTIIKNIARDYLDMKIDVVSKGGYNLNMVLPYMNPYEAINKIMSHTYSEGGSPLFLFETLWDEKVRLISMTDMLFNIEDDEVVQLDHSLIKDSEAAINVYNRSNQINGFVINPSYNTLSLLKKGVFANTNIEADLSKKTIQSIVFDVKKNIKKFSTGRSWLLNPLNEESLQDVKFGFKQSMSYAENDLPTITSTEELEQSKNRSLRLLAGSFNGELTVDNNPKIRAGGKIWATFPKFIPSFEEGAASTPQVYDHVNSGEFLVSAINHVFKLTDGAWKYNLSLEVIRDGIGK